MKKIILGSFVCISLYSCNTKSSEDNLLVGKRWYIESLTLKLNGENIQDEQSLYSSDPCEKDNFDMYKADGNYERNEGELLCNPTDPKIIEFGTWGFIENNTKLLRRNMSKTDTFHVLRLDQNALILQLKETSNNIESILTFSYKNR